MAVRVDEDLWRRGLRSLPGHGCTDLSWNRWDLAEEEVCLDENAKSPSCT